MSVSNIKKAVENGETFTKRRESRKVSFDTEAIFKSMENTKENGNDELRMKRFGSGKSSERVESAVYSDSLSYKGDRRW